MHSIPKAFCILLLATHSFLSAAVSIKGTVKDTAGVGIAGVKVTLVKDKSSATTDAQGAFAITGTDVLSSIVPAKHQFRCTLAGNELTIFSALRDAKGHVDLFSGSGMKIASVPFNGSKAGKQTVMLPEFIAGLNLLRVTVGTEALTQPLVCLGNSAKYLKSDPGFSRGAEGFSPAKRATGAALDTLLASKTGYGTAAIPIDSYEKTGVAIVMKAQQTTGEMPLVYDKENTGADCKAPTSFPAFSALKTVSNLPDPFLLDNGARITTKAEWECRRAEIGAQIQYWGTGPKGAPPSGLSATFSNGKLTVVATQGSASITMSSTISTPSGEGPFPLLIQMDGSGVPASIFTGRGCATMSFNSKDFIPNSMSVTRGAGTYFSMYPDKNTGAMIEWAWGVSRIIDGLYKTADQNKIDLKRIAVSGCSYAGKIALYAGAFDERIALTIPEESGGGGEASWRFMATQTGTEDLEAAQGTAWYAQNLKQFTNKDAVKLPFDMHELVAMIAPRAVLAIENTGIDRLGSQAGSVSMKAAAEVWKALGVPDRIGFSQAKAGNHCSFPSSQTADVAAFVDKFLLGKKDVTTAIAKCSYTTDMAKWITWDTPALK
jgi:hypothetical protein